MKRHSKRCSRRRLAVAGSVADDHPFLVGWRSEPERAQGERVERPRHRAVGAAAALDLAAAADRLGDRHAVPLHDLDALDELAGRRRAPSITFDTRNPRRRLGPELLDEERKAGDRSEERRRRDVHGVRVAQVRQDRRRSRDGTRRPTSARARSWSRRSCWTGSIPYIARLSGRCTYSPSSRSVNMVMIASRSTLRQRFDRRGGGARLARGSGRAAASFTSAPHPARRARRGGRAGGRGSRRSAPR